jgi:hypothetical protein
MIKSSINPEKPNTPSMAILNPASTFTGRQQPSDFLYATVDFTVLFLKTYVVSALSESINNHVWSTAFGYCLYIKAFALHKSNKLDRLSVQNVVNGIIVSCK